MAILRVDHPDILEFIHCKATSTELNNFNISVGVTEAFMAAVKNDAEYELLDPRDGKAVQTLNARDVYDQLVTQAWKNGDPGIVFLDRMNRDNPTPALGDIESTNPCGEQPLLPMEACNLGSINLAKFVVTKSDKPQIDYPALKETVWTAVHFLDNTIDMSRYPLPAIDSMVKGNRKIGLGVMGFADMLFQLGIAYNSEAALAVAEEVMGFVQDESHKASLELGKQRGAFPNCKKSRYGKDSAKAYRNATATTIAPTGTLSIISNCSSGIEPLFALSFVRTVMDNDKLVEVNPHFESAVRQRGSFRMRSWKRLPAPGPWLIWGTFPKILNAFSSPPMTSPLNGICACRRPFKNTRTMRSPKRSTWPVSPRWTMCARFMIWPGNWAARA